jgi:ABC-type phosphate transport system substrate-binding protein
MLTRFGASTATGGFMFRAQLDRLSRFGTAATLTAVIVLAACAGGQVAQAQAVRDYITIVGSSTVYPFTTVVAEQFGRATRFKTPKIESTGTGGGFRLFCAGVGVEHPDITNASRRITASEVAQCAANGVTDIVEVKIGYDGIVIANSKSSRRYELTLRQIYLALAKNVPDPSGAQKLVPNPYRQWSDLDAVLPAVKIEVLGPPPTSGTRDAFVELAMDPGCHSFDWVAALDDRAACQAMRGTARTSAGGDNLIVCSTNREVADFLSRQGSRCDGRRRPTRFRRDCRGQLPNFSAALLLRQVRACGYDPGHPRVSPGIHERRRVGRFRLLVGQGADSPPRGRTSAGRAPSREFGKARLGGRQKLTQSAETAWPLPQR